MKMVERLFLFRYAVRSRNWMLHLKSTEDLIGDVISLDRIKYRRMLPVYLAEMKGLQDESPDIWNYVLQGGFTVKKGDIPFTSLGADHAGEQQNKLLKIDGGLIGITKNEQTRTRYFLVASIMAQLSNQLNNMVSITSPLSPIHHKLNERSIKRQSQMYHSLKTVFDERNVSFHSMVEPTMFNIITNVVHPKEIYPDVLSIPEVGEGLHKEFCRERLCENSTMSIWAPIKRVNLRLFTYDNKKKKQSLNNQMSIYTESSNIFARCALAASEKGVGIQNVIGTYELTVVPRSLMNPDGTLYEGGESNET